MDKRVANNIWPRIILIVAFVVVAVGAWGVGRAGADQTGSLVAQGPTSTNGGYDIGTAGSNKAIKPTRKVREFNLVAKEADVTIAPGVTVKGITYNGQVPGPTIRVTEGDTLRVTLKNELSKATTIHWHGLHVPNNMDGVPPLTQQGIEPGQSFTYEFQVSHAGTFMYHSHLNTVEQIDRGLYGPLIIDPATPTPTKFDKEFTMLLSAWNTNNIPSGPTPEQPDQGGGTMEGMPGMTGGEGSQSDQNTPGAMNMNYNYFTINGKAFPSNEAWTVKEGDLVRVRIINISNLAHPMHLHGQDFTVIAKDGEPIKPEQQQTMNTLSVDAGETYDIVIKADNPGKWVFHCHELHHTENNGIEPGGLIQVIQYEGYEAPVQPASQPQEEQTPQPTTVTPIATPTPMPAMPGMNH
ncbi:MAG: multicopper oxidase domain-containing protein [Chloroflexi bacterium]|nr:multicopper oxidase domain-containing protein [Chloroflexota bacterium]